MKETGKELIEFIDQHWEEKKQKNSIENFKRKLETKLEKSESLKEMGKINVLLHKNKAEVMFETSFESLYKHGYWTRNTWGIIRETLAAASIIESGVIQKARKEGKLWLWDPFCGSGTFLIEALSILAEEPMNWEKVKFCMEYWPVHPNEEF